MINRILVVCTGNICRSPTAAHLLREALLGCDIAIGSAGLGALIGQPIDGAALATLECHGHRPQLHRARQLTAELAQEADLILTMEQGQVQGVIQRIPEVRGKIFLLGKWQGELEIPDPYRQGPEAFEHSYGLIERAVASWAGRLLLRR
ncbi:low molecular weight protein-tyrosine-phosphatase [Pseudomonas sp. SCB32]|uniref:low molecular weight protein-tyrosine-phosphatase n=1 Tax=Pseudomonas sp. SCB32 TaxID=2653853 RepID=UPI0012647507|nr:low molecular weight protein-tyrosine-phosphatase [Pseudomonas sp. SCB32]